MFPTFARTAAPGAPIASVVLAVSLALLLSGCGLLFPDKKPPPPPPPNLGGDIESSEQPLPYEVEFVIVEQDGSLTAVPGEQEPGEGETTGDENGENRDGGQETDPEAEAEDRKKAQEEDLPAQMARDDAEAARELARAMDVEGPELVRGLRALSQLVTLQDRPPDGELGLELRARKDVETALDHLASEGYHEGEARFEITGADTGKAHVTFFVRPGPRYVVGDITILYGPRPTIAPQIEPYRDFVFSRDRLPRVRKGFPATARQILESVQRIPVRLKNNGYPDAKIVDEFYYLDRNRRTVNILVDVNPGEPACFGKVVFLGESRVNREYTAKLVPWRLDEPVLWDQRKLDRYLTNLRRSGLFANVTVENPDNRDDRDDREGRNDRDDLDGREGRHGDGTPGMKDIGIRTEDAKHRSVGGMLRYDTDTGFGAEAWWEHRNLFGNGEKLNLTAPYTYTDKGLEFEFLKPAFITRNNMFRVKGDALVENSEAYEREGVDAEVGVVRFWNRNWSTLSGVFGDTGWLRNNEHARRDYVVYGADLRLRRDTRNNRMSPVDGTSMELKLKPMGGEYGGDFTAFGTELSMAGYWAPFKRRGGRPSDKLVLAGRLGFGGLAGASVDNIPSTHRYFLGGEDTVRGYGYQQIGPTDSGGDPRGGRSYQLVNLEARYKLTETLGVVGFLDGGQLYEEEWPRLDTDMKWGAGAGVRYHTPIGPVRFDVAFPLDYVDPPLQVYISIGQSF